MAQKKRKPGRKQERQSVARNSLLFVFSLCLLIAASICMHTVIKRPEICDSPIYDRVARVFSDTQAAPPPQAAAAPAAQSAAGDFEYSFYDLLYHQDHAQTAGEHHYSIQLAAFQSEKRARDYVAGLKKDKRLRCRVDRQGKWLLVRWGSFPTRAAALRYNRKLSKALNRECLVVRL